MAFNRLLQQNRHYSEVLRRPRNVRYRGHSGSEILTASILHVDRIQTCAARNCCYASNAEDPEVAAFVTEAVSKATKSLASRLEQPKALLRFVPLETGDVIAFHAMEHLDRRVRQCRKHAELHFRHFVKELNCR